MRHPGAVTSDARSSTWRDADKVDEYVEPGRAAGRPARRARPSSSRRCPGRCTASLDLGCGDGRLLGARAGCPAWSREAVGLDNSPPMLEPARARFGGDPRVRDRDARPADRVAPARTGSTSSCPASPSTTSPTTASIPVREGHRASPARWGLRRPRGRPVLHARPPGGVLPPHPEARRRSRGHPGRRGGAARLDVAVASSRSTAPGAGGGSPCCAGLVPARSA